jgi:UDP-N-acetylglucosamine acyltransferase
LEVCGGVVRDIIPYGIAHGNRSVLQGLNLIGLREKIYQIKK